MTQTQKEKEERTNTGML